MTVKEAMAHSTEAEIVSGMVGRDQPGWADVGTISITSGKLTAIDFGVLSAEDGVTIDVPPGRYLIQAKVMSFDGNLGISRARALPIGFAGETTATPCGTVPVDFASIAIADMTDAIVGITDDDFSAVSEEISKLEWGIVHGEIVPVTLSSKTIELTCISTGFGDGTYPAWALSDGQQTVGIEVEFVKDGHVFGDPPAGGGRILTSEEFMAEYKRSNDGAES